MSVAKQVTEEMLGFGFVPDEPSHHFLVTIPSGIFSDYQLFGAA